MTGRRSTPDDYHVGKAVAQRQVLNRTIRAQVQTVDAPNGIVTLIYENMPGGGKITSIQPLWMSFPKSDIGSPAWGRFIPQQSDLVRVSFDYDDRPVIVGADISAQKKDVGDGLSGWPALNAEYTKAKNSGSSGPAEKAKFAQFTPIRPGEYDFMSSGGAYIYGSDKGRLYLSGGNVSITLIKNDLRISQRAQLLSHTSDNCELRFGQVRRNNATTQLDSKISADSSGVYKEFSVVIRRTINSQTSQDLSTFKLGNVIDESGSILGSNDNPYRYLYTSYDASGNEALKMAVDNKGNWEVIASDQATIGATFEFEDGDWNTSFKTAAHVNTTKTSIDSPDIHLGAVDAPEALILGNTYGNAEIEYVGDAASQVSDLATSVQTLCTAIVTFCTAVAASSAGAVTTSPGSPITSVVAIGTAASTLLASAQTESAKASAVSSQITTIASSFTDPWSDNLSEIVKIK